MLDEKDGAAQDPSDAASHRNPPDALEIEQAARAWGIETDYWDIWGKQHQASPELEAAILGSLGVDLHSKESLEEAIERRQQRQWRSPLAPTIFLTAGLPHEIPVSLSANQADSRATVRFRLEQGGEIQMDVALEPALGGKRILLKEDLPLGYHELTLTIAGESFGPARLIVCPSRAFEPPWLEHGRAAGIAISLYGLRS